jgi:hypothetical protein
MTDTDTHRHPPDVSVNALRLILATLRYDADALNAITREYGGCLECWQRLAFELASHHAEFLADPCHPSRDDAAQTVETALLIVLDSIDDQRNTTG